MVVRVNGRVFHLSPLPSSLSPLPSHPAWPVNVKVNVIVTNFPKNLEVSLKRHIFAAT